MPSPRVDLDIALAAIDTDLDAMGEEIATIAGNVAQLSTDQRETRQEVRAVGHKLDTLIDLIRMTVLPAIQEIPELRRRLVAVEDGSRKHPLDAE